MKVIETKELPSANRGATDYGDTSGLVFIHAWVTPPLEVAADRRGESTLRAFPVRAVPLLSAFCALRAESAMNEPPESYISETAPPLPEDTLIYTPESWTERLDIPTLFPQAGRLEVELGSGDGGFMLQWAEGRSNTNFIAIERLLGRARKLDRKVRRAGFENLKIVRIEASYFMDWVLPRNSADAVHIYFPDPWPKKRHHRRRLINPEFLATLKNAIKSDGVVYLRTDNVPYFKVMLEVFEADASFTKVETPPELLDVKTDFERYFNSDGTPTQHAAYRLGN